MHCVNELFYILIQFKIFYLLYFPNQITLKQSLAQKLSLIFKFSSIERQTYIPLWIRMSIKDEESMEKFSESVIPLP